MGGDTVRTLLLLIATPHVDVGRNYNCPIFAVNGMTQSKRMSSTL